MTGIVTALAVLYLLSIAYNSGSREAYSRAWKEARRKLGGRRRSGR